MLKANIYNNKGEKTGTVDLKEEIFGIKPKVSLIQEVIRVQMANKRYNIAHSKGRSQKRGGGRKPWRQKGTGRARHGSIRSPLWRGGGVTFGPDKDRNFKKKVNKKVKRKALFMALSDKAINKNVLLFKNLNIDEPKTKKFLELIKNVPVKKPYLLILPDTNLNIIRASNNLKENRCIRADSLNVYDIIKYKSLLMPEESLAIIYKTYLK
ncbi:MAG: 50S ribosomal protein L4 [Patescibacteria group bacterium]|nr:50S ribosomal protein L4 [Patescibacteria group bacterium]